MRLITSAIPSSSIICVQSMDDLPKVHKLVLHVLELERDTIASNLVCWFLEGHNFLYDLSGLRNNYSSNVDQLERIICPSDLRLLYRVRRWLRAVMRGSIYETPMLFVQTLNTGCCGLLIAPNVRLTDFERDSSTGTSS